MEIQYILPNIYLSLYEELWSAPQLQAHGITHIIRIDRQTLRKPVDLNANVIKCLDHYPQSPASLNLNFGQDANVLPNCYKGVRFIEQAIDSGGTVLIIDRLNNEKAIIIVVGYLMYKEHIKFSSAYTRVKHIHPQLELDEFYQKQLHEYEPILQVQRTQSFGSSCSRELRSASMKRKFSCAFDDCFYLTSATSGSPVTDAQSVQQLQITTVPDSIDVIME